MEKAVPLPWLERTALAALWLILLLWLLLTQWVTGLYMFPLYMVAAAAHLWQTAALASRHHCGTPLLWSLHLAYLFIPLGWLLWPRTPPAGRSPLSLTSHLLSAGSMGTMILGMIARVSLGHSGALQVRHRITVAFALVILSALMRVLLPSAGQT